MGSQRDTAVLEFVLDAAPDLPSPHGLAATKRSPPDGVGELAFVILVHKVNMHPGARNCQCASEAGGPAGAAACKTGLESTRPRTMRMLGDLDSADGNLAGAQIGSDIERDSLPSPNA